MMTTPRPEKAEQAAIVQLTRALGGYAYVLGTRRRKGDYPGTNQTPGLPDLWLWLPAQPAHHHPAVALWWECKAARGRRSPEQETFGKLCEAARVPYGYGPLDAYIRQLVDWGRLRADQVPHYRRPA